MNEMMTSDMQEAAVAGENFSVPVEAMAAFGLSAAAGEAVKKKGKKNKNGNG